MTINAKKNTNAYFEDICAGECFAYNGAFYIMAYDENKDYYFGVNLANGETKIFTTDVQVQSLTATVSFKEIQ